MPGSLILVSSQQSAVSSQQSAVSSQQPALRSQSEGGSAISLSGRRFNFYQSPVLYNIFSAPFENAKQVKAIVVTGLLLIKNQNLKLCHTHMESQF
jgi:hypothetical protein